MYFEAVNFFVNMVCSRMYLFTFSDHNISKATRIVFRCAWLVQLLSFERLVQFFIELQIFTFLKVPFPGI